MVRSARTLQVEDGKRFFDEGIRLNGPLAAEGRLPLDLTLEAQIRQIDGIHKVGRVDIG